jgi:hypothetical protein
MEINRLKQEDTKRIGTSKPLQAHLHLQAVRVSNRIRSHSKPSQLNIQVPQSSDLITHLPLLIPDPPHPYLHYYQ